MRVKSFITACTLFATAPAALAADGTITFNGKITTQTCTIKGNGGSNNFAVTLPAVSVSSLPAAGAVTGRTPFNITLSGCTPNAGNVLVYFEPGATVDIASGRLTNSNSSGARNVQVALKNANYSNINLGAAQASQNSQVVALTTGSATMNYFAEYVATGTATAGDLTTSTLYSIIYQ